MIITKKDVTCIVIEGAPALDPVQVFFDNHEPGKGRLTINCYSSSWTAYWGAMSGDSLQQFIRRSDIGYIADRLMCAQVQNRSKAHKNYILRIVKSLKYVLDQLHDREEVIKALGLEGVVL